MIVLAMLIASLSLPASAGTSNGVELPDRDGWCGVATPLNVTGLNCGTAWAEAQPFANRCTDADDGGIDCRVPFKARGSAERWINEGSMRLTLDGACQDESLVGWDIEGAWAVLSCTAEYHVPPGQCRVLYGNATATFTGQLAPPVQADSVKVTTCHLGAAG